MLGPCTGAHQAPAVFYNQVFLVYDPSSATSLLSSFGITTKDVMETRKLVLGRKGSLHEIIKVSIGICIKFHPR